MTIKETLASVAKLMVPCHERGPGRREMVALLRYLADAAELNLSPSYLRLTGEVDAETVEVEYPDGTRISYPYTEWTRP